MSHVTYQWDETTHSVNDFKRDGIVFFDQALTSENFTIAEQIMCEQLASGADTESLVNLHLTDDWFKQFVSLPKFTQTAAHLLESDHVKVFSSLIICKPAKSLMTVPWHQDAAYDWPLSPLDCASLWLAFDDVTISNGAMQVAIGGHAQGKLAMEPTPKLAENDQLFSTQLTHSIPEKTIQKHAIKDVIMKKGEVSFHHGLLPHSSRPNTSNQRRCAFVIRYCRSDATLIKYPGMKREAYFKDFNLFNPNEVSYD